MGVVLKELSGSRQQRQFLVLLIFLSVGVYLNSLFGDFLLDDEILIQKNPAIHSLLGLHLTTYRWIRTFSYAIDYHIWGLHPLGYHLSNILYNTLTVVVVFLLTKKLTGNFFVSLVTGSMFAVHPIHTEAVSYLSGRRDILSAMFYLLGFYTYLKARETRKWWTYSLVAVFYLAGISAKEMAVTLPLLIFAYEVLQTARRWAPVEPSGLRLFVAALGSNLKRFRAVFLLFVALTGLYLYLVLMIQGASGRVTPTHIRWWGGTPLSNFATMACVILSYLKALFFPVVLSVSHMQYPYSASLLDKNVLLSLACIAGLLGLSCVFFRRSWKVTFLIWFFFITLLPVMQIIPHHILMADHYLYLPSYSFCLAAGLASDYVCCNSKGKSVMVLLILVWAGLFASRTMIRNLDWIDVITLTKHDLRHEPQDPVLHFFLGRAYYSKHLLISADKELQQAVSERYDHAFIHATRAAIAYNRGDYKEGEKWTEEALTLDSKNQMAWYNRGTFAMMMGDHEKAFESYTKVERDFEASGAILNLATLYQERGEEDQAEALLSEAVHSHPEWPEYRYGLAEALVRRFEFDGAKSEYEMALKLAGNKPEFKGYLRKMPEKIQWISRLKDQYREAARLLAEKGGDSEGHYLLGRIYWSLIDYESAERELRKSMETNKQSLEAEILLGTVLQKQGRLSEAEALFERLLLRPDPPDELLRAAADCFLGAMKLGRALSLYSEVLKRSPDDETAQEAYRMIKKGQGLLDEAEALTAAGETLKARVRKGMAYEALGRNRKAVAQYEEALQRGLHERQFLNRLAELYRGMGYPYRKRTIRTYRRMLEIDPKDKKADRALGALFFQEVGDYETALYYYKRAFHLVQEPGEDKESRKITDTLQRYVSTFLGYEHSSDMTYVQP